MDLSSEEKLRGISFAENISDIEKILLSGQSDQGMVLRLPSIHP
jgi:hypothetical protein